MARSCERRPQRGSRNSSRMRADLAVDARQQVGCGLRHGGPFTGDSGPSGASGKQASPGGAGTMPDAPAGDPGHARGGRSDGVGARRPCDLGRASARPRLPSCLRAPARRRAGEPQRPPAPSVRRSARATVTVPAVLMCTVWTASMSPGATSVARPLRPNLSAFMTAPPRPRPRRRRPRAGRSSAC